MARPIANLIVCPAQGFRLCRDAIVRFFPWVFLVTIVNGQVPDEATRSLSFWAYRVGNGNWSNIHFETSNGETDTLSLGKFMKGRIHQYEGPAQLIFFREQPEPLPEDPDHMARIPIAFSQIPSGIQEAILIFTAAPAGSKGEFSIHLVDADPSAFPANSIRVFNATGVRLAGRVGNENKYFEPGISSSVSLNPFLEQSLPVAFLVETSEGPKFVFEKTLEYAVNRRVILLLEPPRRKGSYKIQATNLIEIVD